MGTVIRPSVNNLDRKYRAWVVNNPQVFELFEKFAVEAFTKGKKFSASLLAERVRWEATMNWEKVDRFKLSNNFTAYIARDLLVRYPQFQPFLKTKELRAA